MKTTKRKTKSSAAIAPAATPVVAPVRAVAASPAAAPAAPATAAAPEPRTLTMATHCTVKDAAALKTELCAIAAEPSDVTLDVSAIERIDTATMQLVFAFVRDRAAREQRVIIKGEPQSWREAVRLLGVRDLIAPKHKGISA